MRWLLIVNPFACLKLLLIATCILTLGFLLAVSVLRVQVDEALGGRHQIASDPEHVYVPASQHRAATHHE